MEFSEQYLTYGEYKALGGTLDLTPFNLLEFEARRQIDIRTQNRLKGNDNLPQEVKLCMYNLINCINSYYNSSNVASANNVKSENIDGYSVQYISASDIKEVVISKNSEFENIIRTYLLGVIFNGKHLMYVGVE